MDQIFNDSRRVLVVGGGGYVGNAVVRRLLRRGHRVRILDSFIFNHASAIADLIEAPGFSYLRGDLRDRGALEQALDGVTDVVLLAAIVGDPACKRYPGLAEEVNGAGSRLLYEVLESRPVERFVFTSTCSNYGLRETNEAATEESELAPVSLYAETKVAFENHVLERVSGSPFSSTLLRIATAYGMSARMRFDLTVSEFTRTMALGEELLVYDADTWRPYCHVNDIALAIETVLTSPTDLVAGEIFNVGHDDGNYTKRMLVEAVQEHLEGRGRVRFREGGVDPRNYRVSFAKIADRLGFHPQHTIPGAAGALVAATQDGVFDDARVRPDFYQNTTIPDPIRG
jgi:nucleoside-diphosphate-sugar epimerase